MTSQGTHTFLASRRSRASSLLHNAHKWIGKSPSDKEKKLQLKSTQNHSRKDLICYIFEKFIYFSVVRILVERAAEKETGLKDFGGENFYLHINLHGKSLSDKEKNWCVKKLKITDKNP